MTKRVAVNLLATSASFYPLPMISQLHRCRVLRALVRWSGMAQLTPWWSGTGRSDPSPYLLPITYVTVAAAQLTSIGFWLKSQMGVQIARVRKMNEKFFDPIPNLELNSL